MAAINKEMLHQLDTYTKKGARKKAEPDSVVVQSGKGKLLGHSHNHQEAKHTKHEHVRKGIERDQLPDGKGRRKGGRGQQCRQ